MPGVTASQSVLSTLEALAGFDLPLCRELALELKRLETNPEPAGSRPLNLDPFDAPDPRDRVLETAGWAIWYRYDPDADTVEVGHIELSR